jgi:hypothetical protein
VPGIKSRQTPFNWASSPTPNVFIHKYFIQ